MNIHFYRPGMTKTACGRFSGDPDKFPKDHFYCEKWEGVNCPICLQTRVEKQDLTEIETGYTDDTPMPFGKHKGELLSEVPASYLHWLWTQRPLQNRELESYVQRNLRALKQEFPDGIWS